MSTGNRNLENRVKVVIILVRNSDVISRHIINIISQELDLFVDLFRFQLKILRDVFLVFDVLLV
jgi:hypothetical protein